jgi:hypothetical protein
MSSVSSVSATPQYVPKVNAKPVDSDGDNDGSKAGNAEAKPAPKPVSATIGNHINTTA